MPVGGVAVGGTAMCKPGKARMFCALDIAGLEDVRVGESVEKEPKALPSLEPNLARVEERVLNRFPTLYTYLILIPVRMQPRRPIHMQPSVRPGALWSAVVPCETLEESVLLWAFESLP